MRRDAARPVLFIDRSLGRGMVEALRRAGAAVESHDQHFAQDAPDEEWLEHAGRQGWIVITKDRKIRYRPNEMAAYRDHGVLGVFLSNGNATGEENASLMLAALPAIEALSASATPPAMYRLGANGGLTLWEQF